MPMFERITEEQADLLRSARIFFTASVHPELTKGPVGEGPVNVSPKGMTPLHVLDPFRVAYLDFPGSGNETARHAEGAGPVTIMAMSMSAEDAAIVRLYGRARVLSIDACPYADALLEHAAQPEKARQVIEIEVSSTQTSCGYGVPVFEFRGERPRSGRGGRFKPSA